MPSLSAALPATVLPPDESARAQQLQAQLTAGKRAASGKAQDVQGVAAEMASLFVTQMLQAMRRTVPKSGLFNEGFAHDTYVSLFDQEIARHVTQREDFGITALLQRQLQSPGADSQETGEPAATLPRPAAAGKAQLSALSPQAALRPPSTAINAYRQGTGGADSRFILPVAGQTSSDFGWRVHPIDQEERWHGGMDIAAPAGTPVRAAAAGEVVFSGTQSGYGNVVIIEHAEGYSTLYAHNSANLVPVGTTVKQGQPIAAVGSTGRATGPHLHFEVRKAGEQVDPGPFLEAGKTKKILQNTI
jgi:murein DD-endopeptidase MepM/ murein hydrolase activator NlpD